MIDLNEDIFLERVIKENREIYRYTLGYKSIDEIKKYLTYKNFLDLLKEESEKEFVYKKTITA
jgi:hypothetical protein